MPMKRQRALIVALLTIRLTAANISYIDNERNIHVHRYTTITTVVVRFVPKSNIGFPKY